MLLAGLGLGAVIVGMWWVSGRLGFVPEHPVTLEESFLATNSRRMESLSFVAPVAYTMDWLILFSDTSRVLTLGHRQHAGRGAGLGGVSRWPAAASAGKALPAPRTPPTTSSARC